jgi:FMN-dependent NADH-azoreductase
VFGFFGISNVEFVRAEGLAISTEQRAKSLEEAHAAIRTPLAEAA